MEELTFCHCVDDSKQSKPSSASASAAPAAPVAAAASNGIVRKGIRSADEIFKKLKGNYNLDLSQYTIVYEDHLAPAGVQEVPFAQFMASDAPFHRIRLFKRLGEVIWDRKNKIDKI